MTHGRFICLYLQAVLVLPFSNAETVLDGMIGQRDTFHWNKTTGRNLKSALRDKTQLWLNRQVPFVISPGYDQDQKKVIYAAISAIETSTCVRFKKRTTEPDYILFRSLVGCHSDVGRTGGEQLISLTPSCLFMGPGLVVHELMHLLGFFHEHTRPDRDDFVRVLEENIQTSALENFRKRSPELVDTLGLEYDFNSILHYGRTAFSKDGRSPTLQVLDPSQGELMGQREELSTLDVQKINRLYQCDRTSCDLPPNPKDGETKVDGELLVGQDVNYVCAEGLEVAGSPKRTCLMSGHWSGIEPQCLEPGSYQYCDFEDPDMCGFVDDSEDDNFFWKRRKGRTPTGPGADHTTHTSQGHYLHMKATLRQPGENVLILSPPFKALPGRDTCLTVAYFLWGQGKGILTVGLRDEDNRVVKIWEKSENPGPGWTTLKLAWNRESSVQVALRATVGSTEFSDVAVDDFMIFTCAEIHSHEVVQPEFK